MKSSPAERRRVARVLAARFPAWADRQAVCTQAGLGDIQLTGRDAVDSWRVVVAEAQGRGRLADLIDHAARRGGDDPRLAALATAAREGRLYWRYRTRARVVAAVVAAVAAAAVLGIAASALGWAWSGGGVGASDAVVQTRIEPPASAPPPPAPPAPASQAAPAPPAEPKAAPIPVGADPQVCSGRPGALVGYAWAGERAPATVDGAWRVASAVFVRADYPRQENGWSAAGKVVCSLRAGDRVSLAASPIRVEGGHWWVPIVAGSVGR